MQSISGNTFITTNSREVIPGSIFVAVRGQKFDGHSFLKDAVDRGASVLIVEDAANIPADFKGTVETVLDSRKRLAELAGEKYNFPARDLFSIGITGTNGKTSTAFILEHLLTESGLSTGVIGTVDHHLGQKVWPTEMTTPGPLELQSRLREFVEAGAKVLSMEVSSHALDQKRIDGIDFDVAVFTNLTRDHLDYHKTFEDYFAAKEKLFTELLKNSQKLKKRAVINTDDPWGQKLGREISVLGSKDIEIWSFGTKPAPITKEGTSFSNEHLWIQIKSMDFSGTHFSLSFKDKIYEFHWSQIGLHNVLNAVGSLAAILEQPAAMASIQKSLPHFKGVPGRLERVESSSGIHAFVDYAHTPDALENVLVTLNRIQEDSAASSQIWTVFGCGGDRDKGKRPQMAQIAEKYSDRIIVTSDNPRTENPLQIIEDIKAGFTDPTDVHFEADRKIALQYVVTNANPGDVILVAGKGHEDYQIIGTQKFPFSDQLILKDFLQQKTGSSNG